MAEETANQLTHAAGLILSIAGTAVLVNVARLRADAWQMAGCQVYGCTLVALYAASTLSHSFAHPRVRHFFRTVDQVCIFLLIAGTYTPFALAYLREGWLWGLFVGVWGLALTGIFFKVFFRKLENVAIGFYVLIGWLPTVAYDPIVARVPMPALGWILAGGLLYTLGTLFLARDEQVPYFHAVWHVLVIAASICHFIAVMFYVVPWPA